MERYVKPPCGWPDCNKPSVNGYCRDHRAEYMRDYRRRRKVVWSIDREYAEEIAGQPLTDDQIYAFAEAIGLSSVPDALVEIMFSITTQEEA